MGMSHYLSIFNLNEYWVLHQLGIFISEGLGASNFLELYQPPKFSFLLHFWPTFLAVGALSRPKKFDFFSKNFGIFHKFHKTPKTLAKIGAKTSKWSKFGLIL